MEQIKIRAEITRVGNGTDGIPRIVFHAEYHPEISCSIAVNQEIAREAFTGLYREVEITIRLLEGK